MKTKKIIIFQILLVVFFVAFLFWIFDRNFGILGSVSFSQDFKTGNYKLISDMNSALDKGNAKYTDGRPIKGNSVNFHVYKRKSFEKVKIEISYQNIDQEVVKFSLTGREPRILENSSLDQVDLYQYFSHYIEEKSATDKGRSVYLWQNEQSNYSSLQNFLDDLSADKKVVTGGYKFSMRDIFNITENVNQGNMVFNKIIRGSHDLYVYIKGKDSKISFSFADMNMVRGSDEVYVQVYRGLDLLFEQKIDDDGNKSEDKQASSLKNVDINTDNLGEGIYFIKIIANGEITISNIEARSGLFVFNEHVNFFDPNQSFVGYTNAKEIILSTKRPSGLQKVRFGENSVEVAETEKNYKVSSAPYSVVAVPNAVMKVSAQGFISENLDILDLFAPRNIIDFNSGEDFNNADYFITSYLPEQEADQTHKKVLLFDDLDTTSEILDFNFILSDYQQGQEGIIIKDIKVTFSR